MTTENNIDQRLDLIEANDFLFETSRRLKELLPVFKAAGEDIVNRVCDVGIILTDLRTDLAALQLKAAREVTLNPDFCPRDKQCPCED